MNDPKVTVITAVWNGVDTIEACLNSIRNQAYSNLEYIVMDGASGDGTQQVLSENEDVIDYWESEKDDGIYHAWNKALVRASGDWICFLGSDDYWAYPGAIKDMIELAGKDINLISGKVAFVNSAGEIQREYGKPWVWGKIKVGHIIAHPGALFHRSCFEYAGKFDETYIIAADYDFSLRLGRFVKPAFMNRSFVCMGDSGVSRSQIMPVMKESWRAQGSCAEIGKIRATMYFLRNYSIITVKRVLGCL